MIQTDGKSIEEILGSLGLDPNQGTIIDGSSLSAYEIGSIISAPESTAEAFAGGAALTNISYTFKPGGKYAVVGGSGSGKSTFLKILMGYYDNYHGSVLVGGNELKEISSESLFKSLSAIHQNVFILDDTLKNNITLYNAYQDGLYEQAVKNAKLNNLVLSLPNGDSTNLGEGGSKISGGERQRIAIARALIKGSDLIISDEASANLDNETAFGIEKALLETTGLTCVFATHKLTKELLLLCDGILVLKGGELVESGTFDELHSKKGYFFSLYNVNSSS